MKIKMKTDTVQYHIIEYGEWERVVNEFYKPTPEWDFVSDHEANNDSNYSFHVTGEIDEYEKDRILNFIKDSNFEGWMTQVLLDDLCCKGIINKGEYLINVCH